MADIVWRTHPLHAEIEASNEGAIRRKSTAATYAGSIKAGYRYIRFKKNLAVHILVHESFHGLHDHRMIQIHHIDEVKTNNHVTNLMAVTAKEHARLHVRKSCSGRYGQPVEVDRADGTSLTLPSIQQAAHDLGVSRKRVRYGISSQKPVNEHSISRVVPEGEWRPITEGPAAGISACADGRVQCKTTMRATFGVQEADGYMKFSKWPVHYLVCFAFQGPPPGPEFTSVDHIDRVRHNNKASNLRWATPQLQADNSSSKGVELYDIDTNQVIRSFTSAAAAQRETGITNQQISSACILSRRSDKGFVITCGERGRSFRFAGLTKLMKRRIRELYLFTDKFRKPNKIYPVKRHRGKFTYWSFIKTMHQRSKTYTKTFKDKQMCEQYNIEWHSANLIQTYWRIRKAYPLC